VLTEATGLPAEGRNQVGDFRLRAGANVKGPNLLAPATGSRPFVASGAIIAC
jgi:hypothetical protein